MADEEAIKSLIGKFIVKFHKDFNLCEDSLDIAIKSLGGLSNTNYICTIKDKTTSNLIDEIMYRKFGAISDCVDHELETKIINYLALHKIGPSSYEAGKDYRIMEFLKNMQNIDRERTFDMDILKSIFKILNLYNLFSYTYQYSTKGEKLLLTAVNDGIDSERTPIGKTQFENCMVDMYTKAVKAFNKFAAEFKEKLPNTEENKEDYMWLGKFEYHLKNYPTLFTDVYPKEGFVVFCHNDVHRLNFLYKKGDSKLYFLDHEYANLNLPGNDLANYMNESNFCYEPNYEFTPEKCDFDKYFGYYKDYIELFISNHKFLENEKRGKEFIQMIRTKKYYIKLHQVLNLFWLLYCGIYLDYNTWIKDKIGSFYFIHGIHRMIYLELGKKAIDKC